ncbi:PAZ domain protein [Cooperia oncophora]
MLSSKMAALFWLPKRNPPQGQAKSGISCYSRWWFDDVLVGRLSVCFERDGTLTVPVNEMPKELRALINRADASKLTIEITACREAAASFDIADLSAQKNRNWAALDRSWKQFYELLTSQYATDSNLFTQFGFGCLYCQKASENVGYGMQRFFGARKGIKFIEGRRGQPGGVVPALILDHRVGLFFKSQNLMHSVREIDGLQNVERFDFSQNNRGMNPKWREVNDFVKGVRMLYSGTASNPISFVAIGISRKPIVDLEDELPNNARTKVSVLSKFFGTNVRINPHWPAVEWRIRGKIQYFPMELLRVEPNQRVPLEKQLTAKSVGPEQFLLFVIMI